MQLENQVCTLEQGKKFKELGVENNGLFTHVDNRVLGYEGIHQNKKKGDAGIIKFYPALTISELLKALSFILRHDGHDYFMNFSHSMKGYRVIYETQKLGLIFNLDDELDREKKALFSTMRSGKVAAHVLAEYLRMLLESNSGVLNVSDINERLKNS